MSSKIVSSKKIVTFYLGLLVFTISIFNTDGSRYNLFVLFLSWFVTLISLTQALSYDEQPYSLYKVFHVFYIFFLGVAPALQFKHRVSFWGIPPFSTDQYVLGNLLVLAILIIYIFLYRVIKFPIKKTRNFWNSSFTKRQYISGKRLLLISVFFSLLYLWYRGFNFFSLLFRSVENDTRVQLEGSQTLIINSFIRPIPLACWFVYKVRAIRSRLSIEIVLAIMAILIAFPTGMARYQAATLYIPILIIYSRVFRKNINFILIFSIGLIFIFPILNVFRRVYDGYNPLDAIAVDLFSDMLQGHYDSFQNLLYVVDTGVVTWGRQLLGVLFFWIPRGFWPNKPVGSGHFIAGTYDFSFSNISMNFFAEGYINFGILGILLFIVGLASITKYFDSRYWTSRENRLMRFFYPFLLGLFFFILRGDLMSSFAYTLGTIFSVSFVTIFSAKKDSGRSRT